MVIDMMEAPYLGRTVGCFSFLEAYISHWGTMEVSPQGEVFRPVLTQEPLGPLFIPLSSLPKFLGSVGLRFPAPQLLPELLCTITGFVSSFPELKMLMSSLLHPCLFARPLCLTGGSSSSLSFLFLPHQASPTSSGSV